MRNQFFRPTRWALAFLALVLTGALIMSSAMNAAEDDDPVTARSKATIEMNNGNFKVAYDSFRKLTLAPKTDPATVGHDLDQAVNCLNRLGRTQEFDELIESAIDVHSRNWQFLRSASQSYRSINHTGTIVGGKFQRGHHQGRGKYANAYDRDRVRSLQLLDQARTLAIDIPAAERGQLLYEYASAIQSGLGSLNSWRLQILTDLSTLPDLEDNYWRGYRNEGAPVDVDGNPVLHRIPLTFDAAGSDGERWRWLLAEVERLQPTRRPELLSVYANFLYNQFGVQTMAQFQWMRNGLQHDDEQDQSGTFALHTLSDDETIARLATGVRRFKLPKELHFIALNREIISLTKSGPGESARDQLARIYENRRQYPKAAEAWRQAIQDCGPGHNGSRKKSLAQIVDSWGRFEPSQVQPSGRGAVVDFRFRNGTSVDFEAFPIDIETLLQDVKSHLKSNPQQLDGNKLNIQNIGHRIVSQDETKYLGQRVANWTVALKPRPNHVDDRITVTTPLQQPGAYLVRAKMNDGNVSQIIVWVDDTVIVRKPLDKRMLYYIADATSGEPVAKANVEFFGWQSHYEQQGRKHTVLTRNFAEFSDADGQLSIDGGKDNQNFQWLITARSKEGRLAFMGFDRVWFSGRHDTQYNQRKVFLITDRPVYRTEQKVQFKFWVRHAQYDQADVSQFAGQEFSVICANPQNEHVFKKQVKADEYGGLSGEFELADEAKLGNYQLYLDGYGGGSFRVEEYKKPEFEVTIAAPDEPVQLGEKITATINAKYYFGAPVTNARVKYKVLRTAHDSRWSPAGEWDWFYSRGYWWFGYDYDWYPGWGKWGCRAPIAWWWPRANDPPEIVAEAEVDIAEDGTVKVEIDTALAEEIHGDQDHRYEITAEVVDESRRTIVGKGEVLVARKPFQVFAWVNRGHYRTGDDIQASFQAHTLDQKPVQGKGELTLYSIGYKDGEPEEKVVEQWALDTNEQGRATQQFKAAAPGQYRLSYRVTDSAEHAIEGGYLFVVTGENFTGREFRFNDLELITDKREYRPGDTVRLMVNTQRVDSSVLLFLRPSNGVYLPPQLLRLDGKSTVHEFAVVKKDMPNFFIEALTVSDAKVHTVAKEVVVPPEKRVLNVDVKPSSERYKPGEEATVSVRVTDHEGKPFVGSTVLSVYDKSVEYISGGSNVPEIREFFWKWRRSHHPNTHSNLNRWSGNLIKPGEPGMSNLGVFGDNIVEELEELSSIRGQRREGRVSFFSKRDAAKSLGFGDAMPMAESGALMEKAANDSVMAGNASGMAGGGAEGNLVEPTVRKNFADTAYWAAAISTDENGNAQVKFPMPESLTGWKVRVWGMGHGTRVGEGTAEVVTAKDLLVRLQAPRFFVEKDEVVLSANVHNYLDTDKQVQVVLELEGGTLAPMNDDLTQSVLVSANGEKRVDWRIRVTGEGEATVRMKALTDEESDAMQLSFPCFVHGMLKTDSYSGVVRAIKAVADSQQITINVPEERRPEQTRLEVRYSPTLAGAMVDALPYLVEYPYGCTEQTLNRFIPTVVTQRILQRMNLNLADIRDKRTNLNAQEIGDDVERAKRWKTFEPNPVFDEDEVERMVKQGVERLTSMQLSDGGWGWFSGWGERSWPHTTAVVVHGLQTATKNDVALVPEMLDRGVAWLQKYQAEQVQYLKNALIEDVEKRRTLRTKSHTDNLDAFVFMVLNDAGQVNDEMRDFLYRDRTHLSVYGKAVYGLALHSLNEGEKLAMILQNIEQFVVEDAENQTAYLQLPNGNAWWYWWGNDLEANAWYLKLLAKIAPKSDRAAGLVKYILNNRRHGSYWRSTRDTAYCIEALADYLTASGEDQPDMTIEILVDGKQYKSVKVDSSNLFSFDNKLILEGDALSSGEHVVEVRRSGTGPVYFNAYLTNFTLEDFITKAGLEVKVDRSYYLLKRVDKETKVAGGRGQVVNQKVEKYERTKLENLDTLKSGDLVEVELEIESKNDYEYLVFEDMKAAGFEAVDVRSGYNGNGMGAYVEYRDEKVALFVRQLPRGKHSVSYRLRAEIPGKFSALPTRAKAMYAPELRANSDEIKLNITD
ncbi:MAG: alpha-2-macroglobulin [Rhodopirellula sp.]|nr:alpha-2-macroglobulin [Rhodopirellula sp.]